MILEIPRENISTLLEKTQNQSSADLLKDIQTARAFQQQRFKGTAIQNNASMQAKDIEQFIKLDSASKDFLAQATEKFKAIEFELAPVDFYQKDDDLKRITVRLTLTPSDKTLVSKQVDAIVDQLTKALATKLKFKII